MANNQKIIKRTRLLSLIAAPFIFMGLLFSFVNAADNVESMQDKLDSMQKKIEKELKEKAALEAVYGKVTVQVNTTKGLLNKTVAEISRKEAEIKNLNDQIGLYKKILAAYVQEVYFSNQDPIITLAITNENLNVLSGNEDQMLNIKEKILVILDDINESQDKVTKAKEELAEKKDDHEKILQKQKAEQGEIIEDIQESKATLAELQKKFGELQSDLNKLLGSNYNAKDIKDAISFASGKTGVPKGFLVGMLKMETNLGANVGGCTYGEVESGAQASYKAKKLGPKAWATFQTRRDTFKTICKELKIDYKKQKVSCNPRGYTGTGGAMGVAQFMPDTWNAYKSQVSSITGHRPASPWNLTDGVVAMALKLARVPGVTAGKTSAYKTAACAYLGTCYKPYIDGILYWAKNYEQLI